MEEEFDGIGDHVDMPLINSSMSKTFALRRKEVVTLNPTVTHCHDRWPALFLEEQLNSEYHRITNQQLHESLYSSLDQHKGWMLQIAGKRQGKIGQRISPILKEYNKVGQLPSDVCQHCSKRTTLKSS